MEFDNKVFCWIVFALATFFVVVLLWPTRAPAAGYTCWHVYKGVEITGTRDPAALERAAQGYGIRFTPALRRLVKNCLKGEARFAKRSFR